MKSLYLEVSNTFEQATLGGNSNSDYTKPIQQGTTTTTNTEIKTTNLLSSSPSYEEEEMEEEEEIYQEPEFEESERKPMKPWQVSDCMMDILILTYPRGDVKYSYLSSSVSSIYNELERTIFKPCITVFNTLPEMRKELESAIPENILNSGRFRILENQISSSIFTSHLMTEKKRNHANNFHDMLKMFMAVSDIDRNVILMEDDFMFCKECSSHLVNIFNLAESNRDVYSGIRFSFGLNGIVVQRRDIPSIIKMCERYGFRNFPIDALLEEFLTRSNNFGKIYFKSRQFYTYRFQLMQHIGIVSAVGNNRPERQYDIGFPHCYETIVHAGLLDNFRLESCPDSLFSPCSKESNGEFRHDIYEMPIKTATHRYNLATLKNVDSILCREGEDCSTCCRMNYSTCNPEFFPFINHCDEMSKHMDRPCKCGVETIEFESMAPNVNLLSNECTVGYRPSRFKCENRPTIGSGIRRVCPCQRKRRPNPS